MSKSIRALVQNWLRGQALQHNRLIGLYRRVCRPFGLEWAVYLRQWGGLYAMGEHCAIHPNVTITDPAYVRLGSNVRLSGCTLFGHDGAVNMVNQAFGLKLDRVGKIDIRDNVFIGHQAIVLPGVTIGPNAIVAAGAVVTRDVPPNSVVAGVPARVVCTLDDWVARLQGKNQHLPWAKEFTERSASSAPESQALREQRLRHFFAEEGEHHDQ